MRKEILFASCLLFFLKASAGEFHDLIRSTKGNEENEQQVIEKLDEVDAKKLDEIVDGIAPLHLATKYGLLNLVEKLLDKGVSIDLRSGSGDTAIIIALRYNKPAIYNLLVEHGQKAPDFSGLLFAITEESVRRVLPFIYNKYFTDEELFYKLNAICVFEKNYALMVTEILLAFVDEKFPLGRPSNLALDQIRILLDNIQASSNLRSKLNSLINPAKVFDDRWQEWEDKELASAWTAIHFRMLQRITPLEAIAWVKDKNAARNIEKMTRFSDWTLNWICFQILKEQDTKARRDIVEKFIRIGYEFYHLKNFWGVMQIAAALIKSNANHLTEIKNNKIIEKRDRILNLILQFDNFKNYHEHIAKLPVNTPFIPLINLMLKDLDNLSELKNNDIRAVGKEAAELLVRISNLAKINIYDVKADEKIIYYLESILPITDEVIAEFLNLHRPSNDDEKRACPNTRLIDWTCSDLISYIYMLKIPDVANKILLAGIWTGKELLDFLGSTPTRSGQEELMMNLGVDEKSAKMLVSAIRLGGPVKSSYF